MNALKIALKLSINLTKKYEQDIDVKIWNVVNNRITLIFRGRFLNTDVDFITFRITVNDNISYVDLKKKVDPLIKYMCDMY
jgi:hypothetical protein